MTKSLPLGKISQRRRVQVIEGFPGAIFFEGHLDVKIDE